MNKKVIEVFNERAAQYYTPGGIYDVLNVHDHERIIHTMLAIKMARFFCSPEGSPQYEDALIDIQGYLKCWEFYSKGCIPKKDDFKGCTVKGILFCELERPSGCRHTFYEHLEHIAIKFMNGIKFEPELFIQIHKLFKERDVLYFYGEEVCVPKGNK